MTFARALLPPILALVAFAACSGSEPTDKAAAPSDAILEMLEEVATLRGLDAPTDFRVEAVAPADAVEVYTGLIDEETQEALQAGGALYQMLGYLDRDETYWDVTESIAGGAAGFYSYEDKTLWVVTDEAEIDLEALSDDERFTLAHEMVHAIQDHHFGLLRSAGRIAPTIDAGLAWTSVIEGDAMLSTLLWDGGVSLRPAGGAGGAVLMLANVAQDELDPQIERTFWFPYISGAVAMQTLVGRDGWEALNTLFEVPPPSTAHILHPNLLGSGWLPESVGHLLPAEGVALGLGSDWTEVESGVLGEFHLVNYLLGKAGGYPWTDGSDPPTVAAGEGWRGDAYRLFENGEELALVVVVRFDTERDALQFDYAHRLALVRATSIADLPYPLVTRDDGFVVGRVDPLGRTVFFAIGTSAEVVRAALAVLVGG